MNVNLPTSWLSPKMIGSIGIGAVIALYLVYQGALYLPDIYEKLIRLESLTVEAKSNAEMRDAVMIKLLQGVCLGVHETKVEQIQYCTVPLAQ